MRHSTGGMITVSAVSTSSNGFLAGGPIPNTVGIRCSCHEIEGRMVRYIDGVYAGNCFLCGERVVMKDLEGGTWAERARGLVEQYLRYKELGTDENLPDSFFDELDLARRCLLVDLEAILDAQGLFETLDSIRAAELRAILE